MSSPSVLFVADVALARAASLYFRAIQPSVAGGWDRVCLNQLGVRAMWALEDEPYAPGRPASTVAHDVDVDDYDIVVLTPWLALDLEATGGRRLRIEEWSWQWLRWISERQAAGTRVLLEIDDYMHGWHELPLLNGNDEVLVDQKRLRRLVGIFEQFLRAADGLLCSTQFTATKYRRFNRTFACLNILDSDEWAQRTEPDDDLVRIGFYANPTDGRAMLPQWLPAIERILERYNNVHFMVIGVPEMVAPMQRRIGSDRCISHAPINDYAEYRTALAQIDIAIAPVPHIDAYRGKTDQRWLTASALGIPTVADPWTYLDVIDGETGLLAGTIVEAERQIERLLQDPELRARIGSQAREHVIQHRDMHVGVDQWRRAFRRVMRPPPAAIGGGARIGGRR